MTQETQNIENSIEAFIAAYNSGDLNTVLSYYGDDLIKLRAGSASESKGELASRLAKVFADYQTNVEVSNDETLASGDIAFTRGTFRVTLAPKKDGDPVVLNRRYFELWRKSNGRWLVVRTMDNDAGRD